MLEKSRNFAHAIRSGRKFTFDMGFKVGVAKWLDSATYTTFNGVRLELRFTYMYENQYTHVTHQYLPKVS